MSCVNYECITCGYYDHKARFDEAKGEMVCSKCGSDRLLRDVDEDFSREDDYECDEETEGHFEGSFA